MEGVPRPLPGVQPQLMGALQERDPVLQNISAETENPCFLMSSPGFLNIHSDFSKQRSYLPTASQSVASTLYQCNFLTTSATMCLIFLSHCSNFPTKERGF